MPTSEVSQLVVRTLGPGAEGEFQRVLLCADVVYNGLGMPRAQGAVLLQQAGQLAATAGTDLTESSYAEGSLTIADVSDCQGTARAFPEARRVEAGFAVSPPVVNAHTHLDLSSMQFSQSGYSEFIQRVIAHGRSGGRGVAAAKAGLSELRRVGTTVIGDIVTDVEVMRHLLQQTDVVGVAYWEVVAPFSEQAEEVFTSTVRLLGEFRSLERPGGMRVGLSPHTPHTVSPELMVRLTRWARHEGLPVAIHVAESPEESRLYQSGTGPLADGLTAAGLPIRVPGVSPVRYLHDLGALEGSPTLIHVVQVSEEDVRLIARANCPVVHCPRSNIALGCGEFPWRLYSKHSVEVAIGTDSSGSCPDLDVTADVAAARTMHGAAANPRDLVRAAVKGGYKALGMTPPQVLRGAAADSLVVWG